MLRDLMLGPGESPVVNGLTLWGLVEDILEMRRVEFGGNDDNHIRLEEALWAPVFNVEE